MKLSEIGARKGLNVSALRASVIKNFERACSDGVHDEFVNDVFSSITNNTKVSREKSKRMNFWTDEALADKFAADAMKAKMTRQAYFERLFYTDNGPHVRDLADRLADHLRDAERLDMTPLSEDLGDCFAPVMRILEDRGVADFEGNDLVYVKKDVDTAHELALSGVRKKMNFWVTDEFLSAFKARCDDFGMTGKNYFEYLIGG